MWRAIWARITLLWFGKSIDLNDPERKAEMERMRRDHPELFTDDPAK
jgi:hypothetical protein